MQPYNPKAPSRSEALIETLRDPYKPQGQLRPLCLEAAAEIERLREQEFRLARRIHEQRVNLRMNWQIVEMRASHQRAWLQSPLLMAMLKTRRRRAFLDRWYGDGCPSWTWPLSMGIICAVVYTAARHF